jgi:hypothetical protein
MKWLSDNLLLGFGVYGIRPHRNDTHTLRYLCRDSWVARQIEKLEIHASDININEWENNTIKTHFWQADDYVWRDDEGNRKDLRLPRDFRDKVESNSHDHCNETILNEIILRLPNLKR